MDRFGNNTPQKAARRNSKPIVFIVIGLIAVAALVFILIAVNNDNNRSSTTTTDTRSGSEQPAHEPKEPSPVPPAATGTVITTGDSQFGTMLFNEKKQAIYIWELEESSKAECYGDCAEAWPPVLTDGAPRAVGEVNGDLLGTTKRSDGNTQVTYNGHPLYYYAHEGAGEVKCHNVSTHGGLWWVVQPNGNRAE